MVQHNTVIALGVMSGTSLDGIDFALCKFTKKNEQWKYKILKTNTYKYSDEWVLKLSTAQNLNIYDFIKLHKDYGTYTGKLVNEFLKNSKKPNFIASHGHTIFHDPSQKLTFQIGDGAFIAAETNISTVSDFRTLDTALGGQGAPLVPIGDKLLFQEYDYCLNLGGFANISYDVEDKRIAFDICPVNFILNLLAKQKGKSYDKDGELGKKGTVNNNLLDELNNIEYYSRPAPKSLARENVESDFIPILKKYNIPTENKISTFYEHIICQIEAACFRDREVKVLLTGGGAHNKFLISKLKKSTKHKIIVPENDIIDYKEAIVFAFLGLLRFTGQVNTLASVTGSSSDRSSGVIHHIYKHNN